ncbi:BlaI/MecI/CopY family transcriptional regulator [Gilvimarinus xylanilyticus]|uniref:BlaI/MecI/CopY family transcriptional regulator n=1 Tax=Gilvimarinus xylanilyticus TaxID=2944139 RepID=A0A9X2HWQ5_9GAMM|nr:BlaI/MecI/CopY family transcriptional regulator [Gilvimarinus xylanilyticus]MCP8898449.1 BlaI/MecI/CopY family transcriptional regulator [Gilvimarinus xylanilyticus]
MKSRSLSNTLPQLGELELSVLRLLWECPEQDVKTIFAALPQGRSLSLNTVQSTLERLFRKQLLQREKRGRAYFYRPALDRGEFLGKLLGGVIAKVHTGTLSPILSGFVDFADSISDDSLSELEQLIAAKREQREES